MNAHRAPAASHVEQTIAGLRSSLRADEIDLAGLGDLEGVLGEAKTAHEYVMEGPSTIS